MKTVGGGKIKKTDTKKEVIAHGCKDGAPNFTILENKKVHLFKTTQAHHLVAFI